MISKTIFFYWGNERMSWMRYMTLKSFRLVNPSWKMTLYYTALSATKKTWNSKENQDFFNYNGIDYFSKIKKLNINIVPWQLKNNNIIPNKSINNIGASHLSNFLKWNKLYEEGGIYSDLDIIYFKPIDDFYTLLLSNDTAICQTNYLSIGFLASKKNNDFFKDIFVHAFDNYTATRYQSAGVETIYNLYKSRPNNILTLAKTRYSHLSFYNIPFNLVYPYDSTQVEYAFNTNININTLNNSIGYHWYAGHPEAQKFNNILTENNYQNYNNLFTNIAKKILN